MEERQHALLSPSASHRWLECTASPRLEATVEDTGSDYAREGSLAHAIAAKTLKAELGQSTDLEEAEIAELQQYHTTEMDDHVAAYCCIVRETLADHAERLAHSRLFVEVRLDFGQWIPDSFGTADAIVIGDGVLEVIDLKYGKGVAVSAKQNPQMMIYALGALERYADDYDVSEVRMTIVQPRLGAMSSWVITVDELTDWAETTLKRKAAEAFDGGHTKPGEWCRFCKVKGECKALALAATSDRRPPELMDNGEISAALAAIPTLKIWINAVEDLALSKALGGEKLPGYKLVAGRSVRKIVDQVAAMKALMSAGYGSADIAETKLKGITELEKTVGKKRLGQLLEGLIQKPQGKPTLASAEDSREEIDPRAHIFDDID